MSRPRFSEALVSRRHELGLSISQASRILKLREDVLVAFEEGDYDHMPQSGYAQGMLSSYARYLGLNAREIVDIFQEEIYEYRHGTSSHELRRRTRDTQAGRGISGYDVVNEAGSRPKAYVEYRPLLPSSGGPAGDMGDFATTAPARPRSSVPLAGVTYPTTAGSLPQASYESRGYAPGYEDRYQRRPYNSAPPRERGGSSTARRRAAGSRRRADDQAGRLLREGQNAPARAADERGEARTGRLYRRDDVSTRRVRPSEYTDDLRLDDRANPYAPASTISGRRSSRNIANVERPNVRRRPARSPRGSAGGRGGRRPGARGAVQGFFSDPRRALLVIFLALTVALTAIIVFSVSSCVSGPERRPGGQSVEVNGVTKDTTTDTTTDDTDKDADTTSQPDPDPAADDTDGTDGAADADATDPADPDADAAAEEPKETVVDVRVADGSYSWVEIVCDGESKVAEGLTGPWTQSYTVHDQISVTAGSPDVVSVTENGEAVDFNSRVGGLGTVTIKGTPPQDDAAGASDASTDDAQAQGGGAQ